MTIINKWANLMLSLLSLLVLLILPVLGEAAVSGNCSNCHTMHNSEQGAPVAYTRTSAGEILISAQPLANLLRTDCVGCHTDGGAKTIRTEGGARVPIVFNLLEPTYPPDGSTTSTLAGGNFHWVASKGDEYGHNVHGISMPDSRLTTAPGDANMGQTCNNCHGTLATAASGCQGCHVPWHHAPGNNPVAGKDEGWFRFLGSSMIAAGYGTGVGGVVGIPDPDWEQDPAFNRHNTYAGAMNYGAGYMSSGSINQKCRGCHVEFHENMGAGGVWIRHPTDVAIPDSGEFTGYTTYNPMVPVSRQHISADDKNFSVINLGSDMVSCLSCHRAHGSPYPAMLRWGYFDWPGTDSHTGNLAWNGCAVCHTHKD